MQVWRIPVENENELTVDELFGKIEEIVTELGNPDIAIEDAFGKYETGMKLLKECSDKIDTIEKKVLAIGADGELSEF